MDSSSPLNSPASSKSPKALWAVIGALAVAVAALGGVLLTRQGPSASAPPPVVASGTPQAPDDFKPQVMPAAPSVPQTAAGMAPAATMPAPARAPEPVPAQAMAAGPGPAPGVDTRVAAAPPVCAVCGRVESVRPVQRAQRTTGVGAVAGGVVGGLVGNQFGHGNGRAATTVLGAVGGGFAGNAIERHVRTVTVYEVGVRMENGSMRTVETRSAPPIGKPVTLRGNVLRPANGRK